MIEFDPMRVVRPLLATLACVLLAAHVLRLGAPVLALVAAALPLLLLVRRGWAVRTVQVLLTLGALEWLRTLASLLDARRAAGLPAARLAAILVAVTLVTVVAAMLLATWRSRGPRDPAASTGSAE